MKKITGMLFVILISSYCFAAKFVMTPTVGFSNFSMNGLEVNVGHGLPPSKTKLSLNSFDISFALGSVAENGFTFLWDNNIAVGGKGKVTIGSLSDDVKTGGALYQGNLLFGYTVKDIKNLYINFAAGLGGGIGLMTIDEVNGVPIPQKNTVFMATAGIPVHLGAQYFFTEKIGVNLSLTNIAGVAGVISSYSDQLGFGNHFVLKAGPFFRF